jgi:hypothetical protein
MRKLVVNVLLAGAMAGGLSLAQADEAPGVDGGAAVEVTAVDVAPTVELPVEEMPAEEVVGVGEVVAAEELPVELVDPPQDTVVDTGEAVVEDPDGEAVDGATDDGEASEEQIYTMLPVEEGDGSGAKEGELVEAVPLEENVIMPPANPEDGMMYITGAPVGIEATSGLADGAAGEAAQPRIGVDDAVSAEADAGGFPAPMDVIDADPLAGKRAAPATPR